TSLLALWAGFEWVGFLMLPGGAEDANQKSVRRQSWESGERRAPGGEVALFIRPLAAKIFSGITKLSQETSHGALAFPVVFLADGGVAGGLCPISRSLAGQGGPAARAGFISADLLLHQKRG